MTNDHVVKIVQNRAPSEIAYVVSGDETTAFINRWRAENPDHFVFAQVLPLQAWSPSAPIPVTYRSSQETP